MYTHYKHRGIYTYLYAYMCICVYIYIEREREMGVYSYICIYIYSPNFWRTWTNIIPYVNGCKNLQQVLVK